MRHGRDLGDAEAVIKNWERIKAEERNAKGQNDKGLLDSIPVDLPALTQAETFQKRAARVGFDWDDIQGVIDKICEEVEEVRRASTDEERAEEIGDLLFAIVNLARWLDADPEAVLRATNLKFRERFRYIEKHAKAEGRELSEMSLAEIDALWDEAKKSEL